ncbi:hypothetical protein EXW93_13900 [Exiguobacterium sp. JMULE1]|uniref:nucleotidyltransferase domain-containing protein n=1 Tax=Exiguobacterium sp. JMULE1 TaxID=2518339 RepID=UPI0015775CDF|nr:nucleotidyltransferase family protein [Exiguobacterium sp. JMULE1]NTY10689.1 hypothetical protein [Exiguobacterium sp. JMULE1]
MKKTNIERLCVFTLLQPLISKKMIDNDKILIYSKFYHYHRLNQCIPNEKWLQLKVRMQKSLQKKQVIFKIFSFSTELVRIITMLHSENIPVICLKGPVIGQLIYDSIKDREFRDLDLLIQDSNLVEAARLLNKIGYIKASLYEYDTKRAHHLVFIHPKTSHIIELHWRLHPNIIAEPTFEELWARHETVRIAGTDIPCLETTELFVYLISHGSKHAWFRLRWLYDIHLFLEQPLDLVEIQTRLAKRGCLHMMGQALLLRQELFEGDIPESFVHLTKDRKSKRMAKMALRIIEEQNDPGKANQTLYEYWYWKRYFWLIRDSSRRFEFVWHHLIPNQQDKEIIPLPQSLHFLYIPLRPLTWSLRRWKGRTSS